MQAVISAARRKPRRRASGHRRSAARRSRKRGAGARSTRAGSTRPPAGGRQQVDELRVGRPVAERLGHAAARERAGEDLGPDRVQPGVLAVEERRVRRERQQRRQQAAQVVADGDRPVGPADADVHVQAPGVVALRDPAQLLAQPGVVLGVDDPLVEVARPRVGARGGERRSRAARRGRTAAGGARPAARSPRRSSRPAPSGSRSRCRSARRPPIRRAARPPCTAPRAPRTGARARGCRDRRGRTPPRARS